MSFSMYKMFNSIHLKHQNWLSCYRWKPIVKPLFTTTPQKQIFSGFLVIFKSAKGSQEQQQQQQQQNWRPAALDLLCKQRNKQKQTSPNYFDSYFDLTRNTVGYKNLNDEKMIVKDHLLGLPWWLSGRESACQCWRHRFDPWSWKISSTVKRLSPCTTSIEPVLQSLGAATTEVLAP